MSVSKRELESGTPEGQSKRRKTSPSSAEFEEEHTAAEQQVGAPQESYDRKNLLKSGSIPTGKAWRRKTLALQLYIPPIDTIDPLAGVERQLNDILLTYVREAGGILMGWDNARFTDPTACILDESPFSYARIAVDTVIWRPRRGEELEGSIKLMGPSHIGILILGTFNASIPRKLIPKSWKFVEDFNSDNGFWEDGNGRPLELDQILKFNTVSIKKGQNILSVEGSLLDQKAQVKHESSGKKKLEKSHMSASDDSDAAEGDEQAESNAARQAAQQDSSADAEEDGDVEAIEEVEERRAGVKEERSGQDQIDHGRKVLIPDDDEVPEESEEAATTTSTAITPSRADRRAEKKARKAAEEEAQGANDDAEEGVIATSRPSKEELKTEKKARKAARKLAKEERRRSKEHK